MNKVILIILFLLNIIIVRINSFDSTIIIFPITLGITFLLIYKKIFNFKYFSIISVITLIVFILQLRNNNILYSLVSSTTVMLSIFSIASLIQNINEKSIINIYKMITLSLLPLVFILYLLDIDYITVNLYIVYVTIISLVFLTFKKQILYSLLFSIILLSAVVLNYLNLINFDFEYFTYINASLIFGNILGFVYLRKNNKKYKTLYINAEFLTQNVTGVQRLSIEFCKELQSKELDYNVVLLVPNNTEINNHGITLEIKKIGLFKGLLWEQISLPLFMIFKRKSELLCLDNKGPVLYCGSVMIHDVIFFENNFFNNKWSKMMKLITILNIYRYNNIITVSNFTKNRLLYFFNNLNEKNVEVCYTAYDHILNFKEENIKNKYSNYYLSVSSIIKNKNFEFIIELAKQLKDEIFVIIGNKERVKEYYSDIPSNVVFAGYVSDAELGLLYKECKGFITPSKYEGFGLTPLEALGFGCRKIYLSDIEVFKEIYGNVGVFFNPCDINDLISKLNCNDINEDHIKEVLEKYTWCNFTKRVIKYI